MSADNWTTCPRCEKRAEADQEAKILKAGQAYGKVSEEEYYRLLEEARHPSTVEESLREDYGIGVSGNIFEVCYRCRCEDCGFTFGYKHRQTVPLEEKQ